MSEFEGHGRGLVDNRPRMPEHADDSPTGSENLAQIVESEQATRWRYGGDGPHCTRCRRLSMSSRPRMTRL